MEKSTVAMIAFSISLASALASASSRLKSAGQSLEEAARLRADLAIACGPVLDKWKATHITPHELQTRQSIDQAPPLSAAEERALSARIGFIHCSGSCSETDTVDMAALEKKLQAIPRWDRNYELKMLNFQIPFSACLTEKLLGFVDAEQIYGPPENFQATVTDHYLAPLRVLEASAVACSTAIRARPAIDLEGYRQLDTCEFETNVYSRAATVIENGLRHYTGGQPPSVAPAVGVRRAIVNTGEELARNLEWYKTDLIGATAAAAPAATENASRQLR